MKEYKKTLLLVPSAYNSKVMGDISNFIKFYKDKFDLYVIYDKENKIDNGVTFLNKKVTVQQLLLVFLNSTNLLLSIIKSQYLVLLTSTVIVD